MSTLPAVTPTTGSPPNLPSVPNRALPQPVSPAAGSSGDDADGDAAGRAGRRSSGWRWSGSAARPKKVVVPPQPHTESVTGKVNTDRIAMSLTGRAPHHHAVAGRRAMTEFENLGDAEKVKFVEAELAATLNKLDDMLPDFASYRTSATVGNSTPSALVPCTPNGFRQSATSWWLSWRQPSWPGPSWPEAFSAFFGSSTPTSLAARSPTARVCDATLASAS